MFTSKEVGSFLIESLTEEEISLTSYNWFNNQHEKTNGVKLDTIRNVACQIYFNYRLRNIVIFHAEELMSPSSTAHHFMILLLIS